MPAPTRHRYVLPNGQNAVFSIGVGDSLGGVVLDNDALRTLTSDTLSVSAKLGTTAKTMTIAFVSPQTGANIGRYIVTFPAGQLDAAGELYVDIKNQKTGEEAKIIDRWLITVENSDAD